MRLVQLKRRRPTESAGPYRKQVDCPVTVNSLPPDPEPTDEELQPYLSGIDKKIRPELAEERRRDWRRNFARLLWCSDRKEADPDLFAVPYVDDREQYPVYLQSELWKFIRKRVLHNANYECAACEARATEVHHRDYRPRVLRGDDISPLVALCARCHELVEEARQKESWQAGERVLFARVRAKTNTVRNSN